MDSNLPRLYEDYGKYSNYRNFPFDIDGLKPVERRVLLSAYKIARSKFVKSRQVDAYTIGHFHPHGEVYGTIVQMVRQGFLIGQGNFGTNVGIEPVGAAAPRYTECKIDERTIEMAFKQINYVEWIDSELADKEVLFLPTMYPFCLLGNDYTQGIGFGFKTYIPCFDINDLQKRLMWLLGIRKTKPTILPKTDCEITATKEEIEELLTTGKAKIPVSGVIIEDPKTNSVILKSWPPGRKFESLLKTFSKELNDGMIGFTDSSVTETEIKFQVIRERNRDKIYQDFVEKLKEAIQGQISFEMYMSDATQQVVRKSVDNMLLDTFNIFLLINEVMLKDKIEKEKALIDEYTALNKIRKPLSSAISKNIELEIAVIDIEKKTKVPADFIKYLINKYKIHKMFTLNTDTTEIDKRIKDLTGKLKKLKDFVLEQYNGFKW